LLLIGAVLDVLLLGHGLSIQGLPIQGLPI
jgi:hypothetical protein